MGGRPLARRLLRLSSVRVVLLVTLIAAAGMALAQAPASAPVASAECIVLDDFSSFKVGEFPVGWKVREDEGQTVYRVAEESGRHFLRAISRGLGVQAARETEPWNLATHPVLTWAWRPREFPRGADERRSATNDSPLAVYALVQYSRIRGPKALKYIWSERVPVGSRLSSNHGLTQVRVLRSGVPDSKDAWVEERVNVLRDWTAAFKESEAPKPAGIAVLTDADDTRSVAAGDYANFRACRS